MNEDVWFLTSFDPALIKGVIPSNYFFFYIITYIV